MIQPVYQRDIRGGSDKFQAYNSRKNVLNFQ